MNILVVSDNFLSGGLEQHIRALAEEGMKQGDRFYFAFARYEACGIRAIDDNFELALKSPVLGNVSALSEDVEGLCSLIDDHDIDIVHVHPFRGWLAAAIAAEMAAIPVVFTSHGVASYSFADNPSSAVVFQHFLSSSAAAVFSVNPKCSRYLSAYFPGTEIVELNNPVSRPESLSYADGVECCDWLLVSRLDRDKAPGIKAFLEWLPELPINRLRVYGEGNASAELHDLCKALGVSERVDWCGNDPDWIKDIGRYAGVVGLGRVALEAAAAGKPVILLSTDRTPCGVLTPSRCHSSQDCNFNGSLLPALSSPDALSAEIAAIASDDLAVIKNWVENEYSATVVYERYRKAMLGLHRKSCPEFVAYYKALMENPEAMYDPSSHCAVLKRAIVPFAANPIEVNSFMQARLHAELSEERISAARKMGALSSASEKARLEEARKMELAKDSMMVSISELAQRCAEQQKKLESMRKELGRTDTELRSLKSSKSWKAGRAVTAFPRWLRRLWRRK